MAYVENWILGNTKKFLTAFIINQDFTIQKYMIKKLVALVLFFYAGSPTK